LKHKAPKQKPLTKPIGPIGDYAAKKMKTWDAIAKQTNRSNDGHESKESHPHDGLDSDDESNDKPLSKYVVPKVTTRV
jgi:hypothetical protein